MPELEQRLREVRPEWPEPSAAAEARARAALDLLRIDGVTTTVPVHQALLADPEFAAGGVDTAFFERFLASRDLVGVR